MSAESIQSDSDTDSDNSEVELLFGEGKILKKQPFPSKASSVAEHQTERDTNDSTVGKFVANAKNTAGRGKSIVALKRVRYVQKHQRDPLRSNTAARTVQLVEDSESEESNKKRKREGADDQSIVTPCKKKKTSPLEDIDPLFVAQTFGELASRLENDSSDDDKALELYQKKLQIQEKVLGCDDHVDMTTTYHGIGMVLYNQRKYEDALEHYRKALAIRLEVNGPDHPETGTTYHNIGLVFDNQGKYEEAMENFRNAHEIDLKANGPDDPSTATTLHEMGNTLKSQGKHAEALKHLQKAFLIRLKANGMGHEDTKDTFRLMSEAMESE